MDKMKDLINKIPELISDKLAQLKFEKKINIMYNRGTKFVQENINVKSTGCCWLEKAVRMHLMV